MANAHTDTLNTGLFGSFGRSTVQLWEEKDMLVIPVLQQRKKINRESKLTLTTGAPVASFAISMSFKGAPAPLLETPRDLKTASFALHRPANED